MFGFFFSAERRRRRRRDSRPISWTRSSQVYCQCYWYDEDDTTNQRFTSLLNNLKVQERQNRVCTTVAIAIVAETCSPFTVLPALMNEYRVPELNVQNGVLKSLSFLFEYVGEMGKDYIYAVTPLLEDALMDRDLVHRQTAASAVKHMALGVASMACEDALVHLMNFIWPNIFETSPHVINAVTEAIEGMRVALGAAVVLNYCLQGLRGRLDKCTGKSIIQSILALKMRLSLLIP
ncbi:hypothetical protein ABFX02_04G226700 [Erythranthe guttata]